MSTCGICLETITDELAWPSCGHMFHKTCAMNAVQYDTRCPMCRSVSEDLKPRVFDAVDLVRLIIPHAVIVREPESVVIQPTETTGQSPSAMREYRRRRRIIRNNKALL